MKIKLKAGQWYRDREGAIWYCIADSAPRYEDPILFVCENVDRNCDFFRENGLHSDPNEKLRNLIEYLPDCTGFDWKPSKIWRPATIEDAMKAINGENIIARFRENEAYSWRECVLTGLLLHRKNKVWYAMDRGYNQCEVLVD